MGVKVENKRTMADWTDWLCMWIEIELEKEFGNV